MFEQVVNDYKKLDLNKKRTKLIDELKVMIAVLEKICIDNKIEYREIKSKEILDLNKDNVSEEDYLEALFVYVEYLKEVLGSCFLEIVGN